MRDLLVHKEEERPGLSHDRSNSHVQHFPEHPRLSIESQPVSISQLSPSIRAKRRWKRANNYAVRVTHVRQAATDVLEERLRNVKMGKKRQTREAQEEREKRVFDMILKQLKDLDTKLQQIVDSVRPQSKVHHAIGGLIPTQLHRMPRLSEAENGAALRKVMAQESESLGDRAASWIRVLGPANWMTKSHIAYRWLRIRDKAVELKREREILWNRVQASQLALLGRRIEDQNEHLDQLELLVGQQGRILKGLGRGPHLGLARR